MDDVYIIIFLTDKRAVAYSDLTAVAELVKMSRLGLKNALEREDNWFVKDGWILTRGPYGRSKRGLGTREARNKRFGS